MLMAGLHVLQGKGLTGHCGSPCLKSVGVRKANLSTVVQVRPAANCFLMIMSYIERSTLICTHAELTCVTAEPRVGDCGP